MATVRSIKAKFSGSCAAYPCCTQRISVGELVNYQSGLGVWHPTCPTPTTGFYDAAEREELDEARRDGAGRYDAERAEIEAAAAESDEPLFARRPSDLLGRIAAVRTTTQKEHIMSFTEAITLAERIKAEALNPDSIVVRPLTGGIFGVYVGDNQGANILLEVRSYRQWRNESRDFHPLDYR